jgi:uncharacterized protein (TIGR00299 family) protein
MKTIYLDCSSGISGDMFAGAMLDLGADPKKLVDALSSLNLDDFKIEIGKTQKLGVTASSFDVVLKSHEHEHEHTHRHLSDIYAIIDSAPLSDGVKTMSKKIFGVVARAEGKIHGLPPEEVHFHEVGAADSIADIVAAAVCLENIGAESVICSPLSEGSGFVNCEHGIFPVPAPATAEILRVAKIPFKTTETKGEMVTPTGAAIVAAVCQSFGAMPQMAVDKIGYGAGKKDFTHPNVLRAFLGETETPDNSDEIEVLETCIDDSTGEAFGACIEALFKQGVADAFFTPVYMKRNRPAFMLTVLCQKAQVHDAASLIFELTGSIGMRVRTSRRIVMQRVIKKVATPYGVIPVKFSSFEGVSKYKAEERDVANAAAEFNVPVSKVYSQVIKAVEAL